MGNPRHGPGNWRKLADEARSLAKGFHDPEAKRAMLGIAKSYEIIADRYEERTAGKRADRSK